MEHPEIMISYNSEDAEFVTYLADELHKHDLHAWHLKQEDANNPEIVKQKGKVLLNCKIYIVVLSPASCIDSEIKDEMSLAYISNKAMYPLGRKYYRPIAAVMEGGMKLMLAKINWTFFVKEKDYEDSMKNLVTCIRTDLDKAVPVTSRLMDDDEDDDNYESVNEKQTAGHAPFGVFGKNTAQSNQNEGDKEDDNAPEVCEHTNKDIKEDFWERHFAERTEVTFTEFKDKFLEDYQQQIEEELGSDRPQFFVTLLYKDIFVKMDTITRLKYNKFVGRNEDRECDHFFERLKEYAIGSLALREVLNMDSSVRLITIQNLGQFQTPAVIKLLYDFIDDPEPNIRAVAGLSLAKSGKKSKKIEEKLMQLLQDEDRVVRESACLSLAHMKCERSVSAIVDLWRNDAIKHVRDAAEIALTRIGGEEAAKAIKITQVLQGEMTNLREGGAH